MKGAEMSEPTVVLVHGAFADASGWNGVITRLRANGVPVIAPANPLRGIAADSAYIAAVLSQVEVPVVAVGHSYGGAVITNAATEAENVVGLVYVAAFAPEEGETLGAAEADSKDSVLNSALVPRQYPTANGGSATEFSIDRSKVREAFAGDLDDEQVAWIGATQRPVAELAFSEPSGPPAWKDRPSWAVVATGDRAAGADVVRSMAVRAGAKITEIDGSHVIHDLPARSRDDRDHGSRGRGKQPRRREPGCCPTSRSMPSPRNSSAPSSTQSILDPRREIVEVLTEIPAGVESGWHQHPGEEVGYILAGTVEMKIKDQPTLTLHKGDPFLMPPRTPHNARDLGPETGMMLSTYIVEIGEPIAEFTT